jgi:S-adenosylmethionine synthetase
VSKNSDSAINVLLDVVQDQSGKTYTMDHYATRYPTCVENIANFLVRLTGSGKFQIFYLACNRLTATIP